MYKSGAKSSWNYDILRVSVMPPQRLRSAKGCQQSFALDYDDITYIHNLRYTYVRIMTLYNETYTK